MDTDTRRSGNEPLTVTPPTVTLSRWVNEPLPDWQGILSAHEVARLTRRYRWVLATLSCLGGFPKPQRFRGRRIGWKRRDVEDWIAQGSSEGVMSGMRSAQALLATALAKCIASRGRCAGCRRGNHRQAFVYCRADRIPARRDRARRQARRRPKAEVLGPLTITGRLDL